MVLSAHPEGSDLADIIPMNGRDTALRQLARAYVAGRYKRGEIGAATRRNLDQTLRTLCAVHGRRPVAQLGPNMIDRWLASIAHLSPTTRRNHVSRVRRFCRWLIHCGHLRRDPTLRLDPIRQPRKAVVTLTAGEIERLLAHVAHDDRATLVVTLMWDACARCSEVAGIGVEDYDPQRRMLTLRGKGGHEREIPLSHRTAAMLSTYIAAHGLGHGPLLRSRNDLAVGVAGATLSHYVRGWMIAAGVKVRARDGRSAHALRRTGGSELMEASGNIRVPQAYLGHARIETTARYYLRPVALDELRSAVEARHAAPEAKAS